VYNGEAYLEQTLMSLARQSFESLDIIVSDNGSTDRSVEIVNDLRVQDPRIRLFEQSKNLGAAGNYNFTFQQCQSPYFRWLAADDLLSDDALELCWQELRNNPTAVTCYPSTVIIDAQGELLSLYDDRMHLPAASPSARAFAFARRINLCNAALGLHRTETLAKTRLIQPFIGSDAVLLLEMVMQGPVLHCQKARFLRRMHDKGSHEQASNKVQLQEWFAPGRVRRLWIPTRVRLLGGYVRACFRHAANLRTALVSSGLIVAAWSWRRLRANLGLLRRVVFSSKSQPATDSRWGALTQRKSGR